MSIFDWQKFIGRESKSAQIPLSQVDVARAILWDWISDTGAPKTDARSLMTSGYENSAVFSVMNRLANAYTEPPLKVYNKRSKLWLEDHDLQLLLDKPNPFMGQAELLRYHITYKALGGNGYIYKLRNNGYLPGELWPYSDMELLPVPGVAKLIEYYAYGRNLETAIRVERSDVLHEKFAVDVRAKHRGVGALYTIAREYMTDSELTRYVQALIANDAVPRGILTTPANSVRPLTEGERTANREEWQKRFGGDNRGKVAVLSGLQYQRQALDLNEMAVDQVRKSLEARIAAVFEMPLEISGLASGGEQRTYSNYQEARASFAEDTLMGHWHSLEAELNADLVPEYGGPVEVKFDLSGVRALQESLEKKRTFVIEAWKGRLFDQNQALAELGKDPVEGGEGRYYVDSKFGGWVFAEDFKPGQLALRTPDASGDKPGNDDDPNENADDKAPGGDKEDQDAKKQEKE